MSVFRKLQNFFLSGMDERTTETRKKMEYLLRFNLFGLGLFMLLMILRTFGSSNIYLLAGDFNLLLIVIFSLLMIRKKKFTLASGSIFLLPVSIIFYHVIENHFAGITITADSLFATLAFLIFGIMFIGAFAIKRGQIYTFGLISIFTILLHFIVMVSSPYGSPADRDSYTLLFAALIIVLAAILAAILTRKISTDLILVSENSHKKTEDKYLSLFSNMMDGFSLQKIILNEKGEPTNTVFVEVNGAFERFVGLSRDEIIGKYASDIVPGITSSAAKWFNTLSGVALTGKEARIEDYSRHFRRWLDVYAFSPEPGYFVTLVRDITQTMETANALRVSERKNKAMIGALPDDVFIIDEQGNMPEVLTDNDLPGENRDSGNMLNIHDLSYPEETISRILASARLALSAGTLQTIEYETDHNGETSYFEARLMGLNATEVMVINRNITDRKLSEIKLRKAKEKAEESDLLKTAFLANMSHEVLTPMNAIMGFSQILNEEIITDDERIEYARLIRSSGQSLIGLINDIMDLAKIEAGEIRFNITAFEIYPLFEELLSTYRQELMNSGKQDIEITYEISESASLLDIECDRERLKQLLSNLLDNAVKFTHKGKINFGCAEIRPGTFRFFVRDTGIGIPDDKQKIIFERFRQVEENYNRTYGGTGIGLALVKKLVELMGGKISLISENGEGSEFSFTIKNSRLADIPKYILPAAEIPLTRAYDWSGKTIMVTEDIHTNFIFLKRLINNLKAEVLHARNGKEAVELATSGKHIDLILMDLQMPEMNGIEAFREIRKQIPGIRVILQTAYANKDEGNTYSKMGFNGFITKPIKVETLLSLVDKVLSG